MASKPVLFDQQSAKKIARVVEAFEPPIQNVTGKRIPRLFINGSTRCKIKTAADANGVIVVNTWDGTTLGDDDIAVRASTGKGKAGAEVWIIRATPNAGVQLAGEDVLWIEVPVGSTTSPTVIGGSGLTADTTTWSRQANGTPVDVTELTRAVYDVTAHILYGFTRVRSYDSQGRLLSISAETRITLDTLEGC